MHEKVKSIRQVCLLNERLPFMLANQYIISQPLLSQPQPAPHKHETDRFTQSACEDTKSCWQLRLGRLYSFLVRDVTRSDVPISPWIDFTCASRLNTQSIPKALELWRNGVPLNYFHPNKITSMTCSTFQFSIKLDMNGGYRYYKVNKQFS